MGVDPDVIKGVIGKAKVVLTDRQFEYFQDHFERGWPKKTIAEFHGVSYSAVCRTLNRALVIMEQKWGSRVRR